MKRSTIHHILLVLGIVYIAQPLHAAPGAFTDITKDSGLDKIIDTQLAAHPKWWMTGIHLIDLDNDGHLDFFMSCHANGGALAALNDGKGHFKLAAGDWPQTEIHIPYDINEDGKIDLSMTYVDGGGQWWLNQSQPGHLHFVATSVTRDGNSSREQTMIDLNRDGKVDWIRDPENRGNVLDTGDGKGAFTETGKIPGLPGGHQFMVDIDGDGFIDCLIVYSGEYKDLDCKSRVYHNDGKGNFINVTKQSGLPEDGIAIKGFGDFNQDGFPDVLVMDHRKILDVYLNDGKGHFKKKPNAIKMPEFSVGYASWGLCVVTDFDNDGIPDIITNGRNYLKILRGLGDGNFEYMNDKWGIKDLAPAAVDEGLCFGDIDNDGMLDIIGYTNLEPAKLAVYHNDLPRQNFLRVRPVGTAGNKGAAGAKISLFDPTTHKLLASDQVSIYCKQSVQSYYAAAQTERHFGLGKHETVDLTIDFYPSGRKVENKRVSANKIVTVKEDAGQTEEHDLK